MAIKNWNGFKKNGDSYIPNDATARAGVIANTKLIKDTVGWSGKNLLPNFASSTGIFTVNADKTVLANGQTSNATLKITDRMLMNFTLPAGSYILTGCPSGGSLQTYFLNCGRNAITGDPSSSWVAIGNDIGEGVAFTLDSPANVQVSVEIRTNVTNKIFAPMIRKADILDPTYEPYFGSTAFPRSEQAVLGAKNRFKNEKPSDTYANVAVTMNNDGSIKALGQANASQTVILNNNNLGLSKGRYKITNGLTTGTATFSFLVYTTAGGSQTNLAVTNANTPTAEFEVTEANKNSIYVAMYFASGTSYDVTIYPMIYSATDTDPTYAPFAMTNRELTENFTPISYVSSANIFSDSSNVLSSHMTKNAIMAQLKVVSKTEAAVSGSWTTLGVLKEGLRPVEDVNIPAIDYATGAVIGWFQVKSNGNVNALQSTGSAKQVTATAVYFLA